MLDAMGRPITPDKMGTWLYRDNKGTLRSITVARIMFSENDRELYAIDRHCWHSIHDYNWVGPAKEE